MSSRIIPIGIVDNDALALNALTHLIRRSQSPLSVIWATTSATQSIELCSNFPTKPRVVLTDISMPEMSGMELSTQLRYICPDTTIIGITAFEIPKANEVEPHAIVTVIPKETPIPLMVKQIGIIIKDPDLANWHEGLPTDNPLSPLERDILQRYAQGDTTAAIARKLHIGETTVKTHMKRSFDKIGAHSRTEAVVVCVEAGWI